MWVYTGGCNITTGARRGTLYQSSRVRRVAVACRCLDSLDCCALVWEALAASAAERRGARRCAWRVAVRRPGTVFSPGLCVLWEAPVALCAAGSRAGGSALSRRVLLGIYTQPGTSRNCGEVRPCRAGHRGEGRSNALNYGER